MLQILISACLIGENCKWDGSNNRNQDVLDFMKKMEGKAKFHPVCPEQAGGLPTPRAASEIHMPDEAVMNTEGEDVTAEFLLGADFALREAKKYDCTIAILKERSPSCGSNGIYDGTFSHKLREGMGKTAALLAGYGLKVYGESLSLRDIFFRLHRHHVDTSAGYPDCGSHDPRRVCHFFPSIDLAALTGISRHAYDLTAVHRYDKRTAHRTADTC